VGRIGHAHPCLRARICTPNSVCRRVTYATVSAISSYGKQSSRSRVGKRQDRSKFSALCDEMGIDQPQWSEFVKFEDALKFSKAVSFPVLVRPSYVLSGAAMRVIDDEAQLRSFLSGAAVVEQDPAAAHARALRWARGLSECPSAQGA